MVLVLVCITQCTTSFCKITQHRHDAHDSIGMHIHIFLYIRIFYNSIWFITKVGQYTLLNRVAVYTISIKIFKQMWYSVFSSLTLLCYPTLKVRPS